MRAAVARGRACTNSYSFDESGECQEIECQEFQIVRCECQEILLRKAFKWHPLNASVEPWDGVRRAPPPMGRAAIEPFFPNVAIGVKLQCQEIAVSRNSVCKEFRFLDNLEPNSFWNVPTHISWVWLERDPVFAPAREPSLKLHLCTQVLPRLGDRVWYLHRVW